MLLKIKIPRENKQSLNIYLPLIIAWLFLLPILILLLPFYLLIVMICVLKGYGRLALLFIPMFFSVLWNLNGLKVDVQNKAHTIYFSFI
jgi:hypothetical protein